MNEQELLELRNKLSKYTESIFKDVKDARIFNRSNEDFAPIELINFVDRANKVVFDIETQLNLIWKKNEIPTNADII